MKYASRTEKGLRSQNQDSIFVPRGKEISLVMVADGMGGHNKGDVASALAVQVVAAELKKGGSESAKRIILKAVNRANEAIFNMANNNPDYKNMGTTLVLALLYNSRFVAANVGDSRLYLIHNGEITQISTDHSYVAELVALGYITKEEAIHHPRRNLITRALGTRNEEKVDIFEHGWENGDVLLLCSDGLYSELSDDDILKTVLSSDSIDEACDNLVDCALYSGSKDNVSVVLALNEEEWV